MSTNIDRYALLRQVVCSDIHNFYTIQQYTSFPGGCPNQSASRGSEAGGPGPTGQTQLGRTVGTVAMSAVSAFELKVSDFRRHHYHSRRAKAASLQKPEAGHGRAVNEPGVAE